MNLGTMTVKRGGEVKDAFIGGQRSCSNSNDFHCVRKNPVVSIYFPH